MKNKFNNMKSFLLIAIIYFLSILISFLTKTSIKEVINNYQFDVIIILIMMELFTNLIASLGIMEIISIKISKISKGNKRIILCLFGILMFTISAFLNNITAVLIILPIIFVLLKTIGVEKRYFNIFFAVILSLSNTGGASSPIGDFPAIVIMSSHITTFLGYLLRAFPFFLLTSIILILWWTFRVKKEKDVEDEDKKKLAIDILQSKYKNLVIKKDVFIGLIFIFILMFLSWSFIPQDILPPEIIAILGYVLATVFCSIKEIKIIQTIDFKSILTISSFLFLAGVISSTGVLSNIVLFFQQNIENAKLLIIVIMILTSIISGIFGAGAAASAMMPIVITLCTNTLPSSSDWIAVAFAASICAGSSLFLWSATAGFILSKKIDEANIKSFDNNKLVWSVKDYLKYGFQNYFIQISVTIMLICIVL